VQGVLVAMNKCFFLGMRPAFYLLLALMRGDTIGMVFRIEYLFTAKDLRGSSTGLYAMLCCPAFKVTSHTNIVTTVLHAKYVDRIAHISIN